MKTVLYHDKCTDGKVSAALMKILFDYLDIEAQYIPVNYNQPFPDVALDTDVIILDFSYSKEIIIDISTKIKSLIMLDHHESAIRAYNATASTDSDYKNSSIKCPYVIKFVSELSGAGLTYNFLRYYLRVIELSFFVKHSSKSNEFFKDILTKNNLFHITSRVQDRDLWRWEYKDSLATHELLVMYGSTLDCVINLINLPEDEFKDLLSQCQYYVDYRSNLVTKIAQKHNVITLRGNISSEMMNVSIPVLNAPPELASYIGEVLSKDYPFSITYYVDNLNIVKVSLRSNNKVNVAKLAELYNGGGHPNASGMTITFNQLRLILTGEIF